MRILQHKSIERPRGISSSSALLMTSKHFLKQLKYNKQEHTLYLPVDGELTLCPLHRGNVFLPHILPAGSLFWPPWGVTTQYSIRWVSIASYTDTLEWRKRPLGPGTHWVKATYICCRFKLATLTTQRTNFPSIYGGSRLSTMDKNLSVSSTWLTMWPSTQERMCSNHFWCVQIVHGLTACISVTKTCDIRSGATNLFEAWS